MREATIELSNGTRFTIKTNVPEWQMQAAIDNWIVRTNKYNSKSFCQYINSKGHKAKPLNHIPNTK